MSDFTNLDIEHKRELLFNSVALHQAVTKVAELIKADRDEVIAALHNVVKPVVDDLSDKEIETHIQRIEIIFNSVEEIGEVIIKK